MSANASLVSRNALKLGYTNVRIQSMHRGSASSIALMFSTENVTGLEVMFHGSTKEMRAFARELIRHANAAEAKETQA